MAHVRMSEYLRQQIISKVSQLYNGRVQQALREISDKKYEFGKLFYEHEFSETLRTKLNDPELKPFLSYVADLNIICRVGEKSTTIPCAWSPTVPVPIAWADRYYGSGKIKISPDNPVVNPFLSVYLPFREAEKERDQLVAQVREVVYAANTLKQVHEAWPSVLDFVPNEVKEQFYAKVEKSTRNHIKPDINLEESMKFGLMKAKMFNEATKGVAEE